MGTSEFAIGYNSAYPTATPRMLEATESDSPLVSLCSLNPTASESGRSYHVPHKLIGDTAYSEHHQLLIPYIVLSKGILGIDSHYDVTHMEPMTHRMVPANEKPVIHLLFGLQDCDDDSLKRDSLGQHLGWQHRHKLGIGYLYTHGAVHESAGSVDAYASPCGHQV